MAGRIGDLLVTCQAWLDAAEVEAAVARLHADLEAGEWQRRNAEILGRDALDLGYRLVIAEERRSAR